MAGCCDAAGHIFGGVVAAGHILAFAQIACLCPCRNQWFASAWSWRRNEAQTGGVVFTHCAQSQVIGLLVKFNAAVSPVACVSTSMRGRAFSRSKYTMCPEKGTASSTRQPGTCGRMTCHDERSACLVGTGAWATRKSSACPSGAQLVTSTRRSRAASSSSSYSMPVARGATHMGAVSGAWVGISQHSEVSWS